MKAERKPDCGCRQPPDRGVSERLVPFVTSHKQRRSTGHVGGGRGGSLAGFIRSEHRDEVNHT